MRKKVAFLLPWLKMGGTNKIALSFIKELTEYCDVTLILSQNTGELLSDIPEGIDLIIDEMTSFKTIFLDDLKHFRLGKIISDLKYYFIIKIGRDSIDNYRYLVCRNQYITSVNYDCAISYHGQSPERLLNLIYRINADKKVAWIHGDMSFSYNACKRMARYYKRLDHLFFVSNPTKESFYKRVPMAQIPSTVYYNPIDEKAIIALSAEKLDTPFPNNCFKILTVGRISLEKGQDMIPAIALELKDRGYKICWYLIGDGPNRNTVQSLIEYYDVNDEVQILGIRKNPYCYMKVCDLYVQPSYTEGYSTTICEAGILGKAIVGTEPSGGIHDQIRNGIDGLIVDANVTSLVNGIIKLIEQPLLRKEFERNILDKDFSGKGEIKKFLDYLN